MQVRLPWRGSWRERRQQGRAGSMRQVMSGEDCRGSEAVMRQRTAPALARVRRKDHRVHPRESRQPLTRMRLEHPASPRASQEPPWARSTRRAQRCRWLHRHHAEAVRCLAEARARSRNRRTGGPPRLLVRSGPGAVERFARARRTPDVWSRRRGVALAWTPWRQGREAPRAHLPRSPWRARDGGVSPRGEVSEALEPVEAQARKLEEVERPPGAPAWALVDPSP
ncbi:hypothetical protein WA016_01275 [Myxococcus stipitatus]